jgi:hypothetical protein
VDKLGSPPLGDVRVSGRANTPSWVYWRRLTGRLWNTASCLTAAPLTHSWLIWSHACPHTARCVAVLTPDMPDVLSHVSVRARNEGVCFASCFDVGVFAGLCELDGATVQVRFRV